MLMCAHSFASRRSAHTCITPPYTEAARCVPAEARTTLFVLFSDSLTLLITSCALLPISVKDTFWLK